MAKPDKATGNQGQQKTHLVKDAAGNQSTMTQQEWQNRDKSLGLERVDDVETPETPDAPEPTPETPA